ncbi:hypothetical protein MNBD_DELTA02-874 [hydrothermal vent metagenome]|uniref:Uncharacterized protein n=1 Tax=hydrothermal vent metagenome TaxID=652676 RepID=A0A3B0V6R8_9ZZZZ
MELSKENILKYARKYTTRYFDTPDGVEENALKEKLRHQDFLTRDDYINIGLWKSKRPRRHYESPSNSDSLVREVTAFSFSSKDERVKIEKLTSLKGCSYPVASVILHFKFPDRYPILDIRALWSLGKTQPGSSYTFDFWWDYVQEIRELSESLKIDIRTIDKALWYYSKENQR